MVFSSIPFLFFFLPFFLILYYIVPFKVKNYILMVFSLLFYAWGEPVYILLLLFSSIVDYCNGKWIEKNKDNAKKKKFFLLLSIVINIGLLGFFKYIDFFIGNINQLFHLSIPLLNLGLPIGISFFTFQTMSYSIDVYRGEVKAEHNFFYFMTYVSMFPQLIAGPIVRYETVSQELYQRKVNQTNFSNGLIRFIQGLFKKVLLANNIGLLFSILSGMPIHEISVLTGWLAVIAFTFQIYFDFSGYSDMAIGMGLMLGFHYLENFNYPYIAKNITEFWRRWHISLSSWFRDYIYIPLGGSRTSKIKHIRNLLIVWTLTGFWHGSSWNFLLWGLYYGILIVLEKFVLQKHLQKLPSLLQHIYTIFFVLIGWLLFAFTDFNQLISYFKILFGFSSQGWIDHTFLYYFGNYFLILILCTIFSTPIYPKIIKKIENTSYPRKAIFFFTILFIYIILLVITTAYLVSNTYNPFLYFRF